MEQKEESLNRPVRLGVVGPGIIWHRAHKPILKRLAKSFLPVAFCSRTEESREKAASEFAGAKTFSDYEELVKSPDIDAVLVATPIMLNAPVGIAALEAGKHVYLEKPMAALLEDADRIIALEESSGKRVYVLEQVVYSDAWAKLGVVLSSGEIGEPVTYEKASHGFLDASDDPHGYGGTSWRINTEFPLGCLFDGGIHAIALLASFFGPPRAVYATGRSLREGYGEYDNVNMLFEYESGLQGVFSFSGCLGGMRNYFYIRCTKGLISLEDRKFTVEPRFGRARTHNPGEGRRKNPHFDMWRELAECARAGEPPRYTTRMARRDIATLLAVERSIRTGAKVFL